MIVPGGEDCVRARHRASHWLAMHFRRSGVRLSLIAHPWVSQGPAESVRRRACEDNDPRHRASHSPIMHFRRIGVRLSLIAHPRVSQGPAESVRRRACVDNARAIALHIPSSCPQVTGAAVPSGPPRSVRPMKRIILWQTWNPGSGLGASSLFFLISVSISVHQWFISLSGILFRHAAIIIPTISRPAICLPFREDTKSCQPPRARHVNGSRSTGCL